MTLVNTNIVALGGGHGLAATLKALTIIGCHTTAIVTVADDGGSSGQLRQDYGVLPPGDLRMALAALCPQDAHGQQNAELFQHRFAGPGVLSGHPVGNVILTALWQLEGNKVAALSRAASLLGANGTVLPMSTVPLAIEAEVEHFDGIVHRISGQASIAATAGMIRQVSLIPENPPACAEALTAIAAADWIVLGPGSWYTSVLPALIIPELREAITESSAQKLVVLNLVDQPGETEGLGPADHLKVFADYAEGMKVNTVLVDSSHEPFAEKIALRASDIGATAILADIHDAVNPSTHDPERLSRILNEIFARVP